MTRRSVALVLLLGLPTGCGQYYWEASGRGIAEFQADRDQCIQEATIKYDVASERIFRRCMQARQWRRTLVVIPTERTFRGPEDDEEFPAPPDPLGDYRTYQMESEKNGLHGANSVTAGRACVPRIALNSVPDRDSLEDLT